MLVADGWEDVVEGYVSDAALDERYQWADVVVIPSLHENFGLTAAEATARGCAVVVTDTCGFASLASARSCEGIITVGNGREASLAVQWLTADRERLAGRKQAAYELSEDLTWTYIGEQYVDAYERTGAVVGG